MTNVNQAPLPRLSKAPLIRASLVKRRYIKYLTLPLPLQTDRFAESDTDDRYTQARFPFKRNRLRCVRCVNENRKQPIVVATASTEHSYWLALAFLEFSFTQRTQRKRLRLNGNRASRNYRRREY